MKICVIGCGYVGLPTAACFAENGNDVYCIEKNEARLDSLKNGQVPIFEPGLSDLFEKNIERGYLHFFSHLSQAPKADIYFVAVGTPANTDGSADLTQVFATGDELAEVIANEALIVIKSTIPVGTTHKLRDHIASRLAAKQKNINFTVAFNPEFLKQGKAVKDTVNPDRIVIGVENDKAAKILRRLFKPFSRSSDKLLFMDIASAELTKYAANAMLATRISFMNEMALICEKSGADIESVRRGIGTDSRIGKAFLYAGVGYGGSCFPKDVAALIQTAESQNIDARLIKAVQQRNIDQRAWFLDKILAAFSGRVGGLTFGVWGLAFKPETDDIRESPAIYLIKELLQRGAKIQAYDPEAAQNAFLKFQTSPVKSQAEGQLKFCDHAQEVYQGADALILVTEWKEFLTPDFAGIAGAMRGNIIFDGRNQYDVQDLTAANLRYISIGREKHASAPNP